jgi:hypothetical protein
MKALLLVISTIPFLTACSPSDSTKGGTGSADASREATKTVVSDAGPADTYALPEGAVAIGEPITANAPVRLATLRDDPSPWFERTILVEATAVNVCQAMGCWMTIRDGEGEPIWVRWASGCGGQYAFPKDSAGRRVLVQGSIYEKEISPEDAEHLAGESEGLSAEKIAGKTYEMNATACVILAEEAPDPASSAS